MGRGKNAVVGDTRVAANGYHYTKTENGWILTHWLTAEKLLGRPVRSDEQVRFKNKNGRFSPYDETGIIIIKKRLQSLRKRQAVLTARKQDIENELAEIAEKLKLES